MSTVDSTATATATPNGATSPNANELWPIGNNKDLLYAISNYIQQILKDHGTKLLSEELIKLSKIRSDITSLLETITAHDRDVQIPALHFTLPGIYKFYNSVQEETRSPSPSASPPQPTMYKTTLDLTIRSSSSSTSSASSKSHRRCASAIVSSSSSSSSQPVIPSTDDTPMEQQYVEFARFLNELKTQHKKTSEYTPQYLVFLEQARKQFNIVYYGKYCIKSLDDVPTLRSTLYAMRHLPQPSASPQSADEAVLAMSNSPMSSTTNDDALLLLPSSSTATPSTLLSASHELSKKYQVAQTQHIAIMGYLSTYLSVYKNGRSELKKPQIGYNEIFTSVPIEGNKVYIKTISDLYLGSDENGLLFLGNVRKHYQIWSVETCTNNTFAFKNSFGFYLCAYNSGKPRANSKKRSDWEKFRVFPVEDRVFLQCQKQYLREQQHKIHDDEFVQMNVNSAVRRNRTQRKLRRDRKMSIDDMDIPDSVAIDNMNAFLLHLDATKNRRSFSDKQKHSNNRKHGKLSHHQRAASARFQVRPAPPPKTTVSGHGKPKPAPPPPRVRRNRHEETSQTVEIHEENESMSEKRRTLLDGIKRNVSEQTEYDPRFVEELDEKMKTKRRSSSRSIGAVPAVGGIAGGGDDLLMAELRRKLMTKKKPLSIDDEKNVVPVSNGKVEEQNNNNVMDGKEVNEEDGHGEKANKPALPPKSARRVVRKIRSKYQRPLPAVPPKEHEQGDDHEEEEANDDKKEEKVDLDIVKDVEEEVYTEDVAQDKEEEQEVEDVVNNAEEEVMTEDLQQQSNKDVGLHATVGLLMQSMDVLKEEEMID